MTFLGPPLALPFPWASQLVKIFSDKCPKSRYKLFKCMFIVYHSVVVFWCESDRHRPTLVTCLPWCAWPSSWPGRPCWAAGEARKTSRCPSRAGSSRWRGSRPLCGQIISQERHPPLIFNISIERSENPSIELVHCNWLLNYWIDIINHLYDASMLLTMPRTSLARGSFSPAIWDSGMSVCPPPLSARTLIEARGSNWH